MAIYLLKSVLLGVMRLSLSEPGLGPLPFFGFSVTAAAARVTASEQPHRLLMLWRALLTLPAVREMAPLCKTYGDLHRVQLLGPCEITHAYVTVLHLGMHRPFCSSMAHAGTGGTVM